MAALPVSEKICSLSKVDLNLLTIFCLIYSVGSISKVADMLDISASAVSQSLRKLREMMGTTSLSAAATSCCRRCFQMSFTIIQSR